MIRGHGAMCGVGNPVAARWTLSATRRGAKGVGDLAADAGRTKAP